MASIEQSLQQNIPNNPRFNYFRQEKGDTFHTFTVTKPQDQLNLKTLAPVLSGYEIDVRCGFDEDLNYNFAENNQPYLRYKPKKIDNSEHVVIREFKKVISKFYPIHEHKVTESGVVISFVYKPIQIVNEVPVSVRSSVSKTSEQNSRKQLQKIDPPNKHFLENQNNNSGVLMSLQPGLRSGTIYHHPLSPSEI